MDPIFIINENDDNIQVVDTRTDQVIEQFETFTTDTGREIHPMDYQRAKELCDDLNAGAPNE